MIGKYIVAWHEWCSPALSSLPNIHVEYEKVSSDLWHVCLPARQNKTSGWGLMLETRITNPWNSLIQALPLLFFPLMPLDSSEVTAAPDTTESDGWEEVWPASIFWSNLLPLSTLSTFPEERKSIQLMRFVKLYVNCFSYKMRLNWAQWTIDYVSSTLFIIYFSIWYSTCYFAIYFYV